MDEGKPTVENKLVWPITFLIWGCGAAVIYFLWNINPFANDTADTAFGFVLYVVAFFYFFAIAPIRYWVSYKFEENN